MSRRNGGSSPWSPEMVNRFVDLMASGIHHSKCAPILTKEFGVEVTNSMCNGKHYRITLMLRGGTPRPYKPKKLNWIAPFNAHPHRGPVNPKPRPKRTGKGNLDFFDLRPAHCRWPHGDDLPYTYCGERKIDGSPYCLEHSRLAWSPNTVRNRLAGIR